MGGLTTIRKIGQTGKKVSRLVKKPKLLESPHARRYRIDKQYREVYDKTKDPRVKKHMEKTGNYYTVEGEGRTVKPKQLEAKPKTTDGKGSATKKTENVADRTGSATKKAKTVASKTKQTANLPVVANPRVPARVPRADVQFVQVRPTPATPQLVPKNWKQLLRKYGPATAFGAAGLFALLGGNSSANSEEISTEGINELGEETPQLVNNFGHIDESELKEPVVQPNNPNDPSLQTNPRDINGGSSTTGAVASESTPVPPAATPPLVQTSIPVASPFPQGYLIDRRGVRHQLDLIADGAYGSNTYELVKGLENTPDSNPFKKALMNRLGMAAWDSNEAYNRLAQMGIRGYIGGHDRKRIRNLINSGTNINGEIIGHRTGGKLKLVKRYV